MPGEHVHEDRAELYDPIYSGVDYGPQAEWIHERLRAEGIADGARVVEGACGTGSHLAHLSRWYAVEGFDLADGMLAVARRKLPNVRLWKDDLRTFSVAAPADAFLCLFSSIGYVGDATEVARVAKRVAAALRPGGVALVQPWLTPATATHGHVGLTRHETDDLKLARMDVVRIEDGKTVLDFHWLVGSKGVEHFVDRHVLWLHTPEELVGAFRSAGLGAEFEPPFDAPGRGRGVLVARRPAGAAPRGG
jgi:SAM-dependent methyltransferase